MPINRENILITPDSSVHDQNESLIDLDTPKRPTQKAPKRPTQGPDFTHFAQNRAEKPAEPLLFPPPPAEITKTSPILESVEETSARTTVTAIIEPKNEAKTQKRLF